MRKCILLSGLQRNFEPFIKNQLECVIKKYCLDVFIFTSDENNNRFLKYERNKLKDVRYKNSKKFENDEDFFFKKYGKYLKKIYIDKDNKKFKEFLGTTDLTETKEHTKNLISTYFKVMSCIELMEIYEKEYNIRYDKIIRARLDFFSKNIVDLDSLNLKENIYGTIGKGHKDDCFFIMKRENLYIFKNFVFELLKIKNNTNFIIVETELYKYLEKNKINVETIENLACRIGISGRYRDIPFFEEEDIKKLKSLEYEIIY